jgi:MoaA/NifB/PqqE/SkfB family radical SAM enzyme
MTDLGWKYLTAADKANILRGMRDGVAHGGPYHVEIYPADRCNIECFFCSTAAIRGTDELPMTRLEELLGELKTAGTRAISMAGGGEPLFHRKTKDFLRAIAASGIPIENLTTNAVLLNREVAGILIEACDQITVSLNTGDETTYASMMQTPARNFHRVLDNVRGLVELKRQSRSRTPAVILQFLVWKENFRSIAQMYDLARELGVDSILFNGLAFLPAEKKMTTAETDEMMALYKDVVRRDEYRTIRGINTFEQDLAPRVARMNEELTTERESASWSRRLARFLGRRDYTMGQKLGHRLRLRREAEIDRSTAGLTDSCIIGWYSLVVRTNGAVAPCCVIQNRDLGNVFTESVEQIWNGERYRSFRKELSRIMLRGSDWRFDPASDRTVVRMCGEDIADERCFVKSFYFKPDIPFMRQYDALVREARKL